MAKNVLIVDDNEHLRKILAAILRFSGYEIVEAATGAQAIQKAASTQPSLILMDFELPDMNGADAARLIRQNPATAHIPIVGCSAFIGSEWRERALAAGMVDYFVKPISAELIKAKIEKFIVSEK
jgi:CheY-like chemotaxis protein